VVKSKLHALASILALAYELARTWRLAIKSGSAELVAMQGCSELNDPSELSLSADLLWATPSLAVALGVLAFGRC
jgi:hypothetical protein